MPRKVDKSHSHEALIHSHAHTHMTHYVHGGRRHDIEHLTSTHSHKHNHVPVEHAHVAHEDVANTVAGGTFTITATRRGR